MGGVISTTNSYNSAVSQAKVTIVTLGSSINTTYNIKSLCSKWESLTSSNFAVVTNSSSALVTSTIGTANAYAATFSNPSVSYNASTGILTVGNYGFSNGGNKFRVNSYSATIYLYY